MFQWPFSPVLHRSFGIRSRTSFRSVIWVVSWSFVASRFRQGRVGSLSVSGGESSTPLLAEILSKRIMQKPDDLIIHVFYGVKHKKWHGKKIKRSRFRIGDESQLPNRTLLEFHYRQCVVKHIRGFAFFEHTRRTEQIAFQGTLRDSWLHINKRH